MVIKAEDEKDDILVSDLSNLDLKDGINLFGLDDDGLNKFGFIKPKMMQESNASRPESKYRKIQI